MAQPHAHPGGGRPASGVVSRRLAHRVVQRRGRRVRARDRGAGRVEPTPRRDRRALLLLPARVVSRRRPAGLHRHPLPGAGAGRGVRRGGARRHRPLRPSRAHHEPGVVPRLALAGLRASARQPAARRLRPRHRVGRDAPAHRRHVRRDHARLGRVREVPLLPGLHRLRPEHRLARHDFVRPSGHARALSGAAQRGRALSLPSAER